MENFYRVKGNGLDILMTTKENGNMLFQKGGMEVFDNYSSLANLSNIDIKKMVRVVLANGNKFIKVDNSQGGEGAHPDKQNLKGYDGLITTETGLYLGITTADCYPVIIHDPNKNFLGLAHCGWRGIVGKLEVKILKEMVKMGSNMEDVLVTYGAGICNNCYIQHDDYLKNIFIKDYGYPSFVVEDIGRNYSVDIKKASQYNLREAGYSKPFKDLNICNYCDTRFFSVRRDGKDTGRILNLVAMI